MMMVGEVRWHATGHDRAGMVPSHDPSV